MFDLALLIITNIIPLYILIALGYISGRWLDVNLHSIAIIVLYILAPIVNFGALTQMEFTPEYLALPVFVFFLSAIIGITAYKTAQIIWKNNTANLIGMGSLTGNTLYFGLPVVLALCGPKWVGVYALMNLGIFFNEIGLGYYFGARGNGSLKEALIKVIKFPSLHAIILGFIWNLAGWKLPEAGLLYWNYSIGGCIMIGMMIIGVALSKEKYLQFDLKLIINFYIFRFLMWPILGLSMVLCDVFFLKWYEEEVHLMLLVIASVPLAGNLVAYAATFKLQPEKTAATVLLATIIALFSVPAMITLYQYIISG